MKWEQFKIVLLFMDHPVLRENIWGQIVIYLHSVYMILHDTIWYI